MECNFYNIYRHPVKVRYRYSTLSNNAFHFPYVIYYLLYSIYLLICHILFALSVTHYSLCDSSTLWMQHGMQCAMQCGIRLPSVRAVVLDLMLWLDQSWCHSKELISFVHWQIRNWYVSENLPIWMRRVVEPLKVEDFHVVSWLAWDSIPGISVYTHTSYNRISSIIKAGSATGGNSCEIN